MKHPGSLRFLIPAGVLLVFICVMVMSLLTSISQREKNMLLQARERGQLDVARLARYTERLLRVEPQALEEDFTQLATDPGLQVAMLIDPDGMIRFANHFIWRKQPAERILPAEDLPDLAKARQTRVVLVRETRDKNHLKFMMSYATPAGQQLRGFDRGVIYLAYDLSATRDAALTAAIKEREPELAAMILAALLLVWVLHTKITRPLGRIQQATLAMTNGQFQTLRQEGPDEIRALTASFNNMSNQLATQVEQLANQATFTRIILDNAMDGIITSDEQGRIISFNKAAESIFGYNAAEVIGQNIKILMPDSEQAHHDSHMNNYVTTGQSRIIGTGRDVAGKRKDGSLFPMELTVSDIIYEGQRMFIGLARDITERKQAELALIAARDEADRANQTKSEFLSSMSHELRTPMNAILGFGQLLEYDETLSDEHQDNVREIIKAGHHLLTLINEVLDLAKVESGRIDLSLEPVEISTIIEECLSLTRTLAEKRDIRISYSKLEGVAARADRTRLKQVLLNLLSNAVKYNRNGGSVKLAVNTEGEDRLRILITDTGAGIPAARMKELFQPFNRLDAENSGIEGTGIGLTITRRIVELMGGSVNVESEVGVGSTFWIELPLESSTDTQGSDEPEATPYKPGTSPHLYEKQHIVLYIEDNPSNLKLVAQILGHHKHIHLLTAHTPELGIELALARRPELVLLDINMPGMDGYQVMSVFKADERLQSIPVVAVTANAMPRDIEHGKAAGFAEYVTKPLDIPKFHALVDRLLAREDEN